MYVRHVRRGVVLPDEMRPRGVHRTTNPTTGWFRVLLFRLLLGFIPSGAFKWLSQRRVWLAALPKERDPGASEDVE